MSKRRLVVGNWKMYIESPEKAIEFASALRKKSRLFAGVEVVLAPPFPLIPIVGWALKGSQIKTGAQALSPFDEPKHTGEVSAQMLKNAGAAYAIVGHSERRAQGESEEAIQAELVRAAAAGITPVLCVGEKERDAQGSHFSIIAAQLSSALKNQKKLKLVVAYEPLWAIGKSASEAMKPAEAREMSIFIKKTIAEQFDREAALKVPILYGGSVEPENARSLLSEGGVDGFLVGHASAELDSFVEILKAARH